MTRFAILCILLTLFGMWFSSLVASSERPEPRYRSFSSCILDDSAFCRAVRLTGSVQ